MKTYISQPPPQTFTDTDIRASYEQVRHTLPVIMLVITIGFPLLTVVGRAVKGLKQDWRDTFQTVCIVGAACCISAVFTLWVSNCFDYEKFEADYIKNHHLVLVNEK